MQQEGHKVLKEQLTRVFDEIGEYEGRVRLRLHSNDIVVLEELGEKQLTLQVEADDALCQW